MADGLSLVGSLNRLAKTNGLAGPAAAQVWTGCPYPYSIVGCLNWKQYGENRSQWLGLDGICNILAGNTNQSTWLAASGALQSIPTPP